MKKFTVIFILLTAGVFVSACSVNLNENQQVEGQSQQEAGEMRQEQTDGTSQDEAGNIPDVGETQEQNDGNTDITGEKVSGDGDRLLVEGQSQQIFGYELVDGDCVPVTVTFTLKEVLRGEEAYQKLAEKNVGLAEAPEGMEYVAADIAVSYDDGEAESLYLAKNEASLPSAKLYFSLSNGDSNGEDLTEGMADSIYNLELQKGETGEGTVVFLHDKDSEEPLYFTGFDNVIKFDIKK